MCRGKAAVRLRACANCHSKLWALAARRLSYLVHDRSPIRGIYIACGITDTLS